LPSVFLNCLPVYSTVFKEFHGIFGGKSIPEFCFGIAAKILCLASAFPLGDLHDGSLQGELVLGALATCLLRVLMPVVDFGTTSSPITSLIWRSRASILLSLQSGSV